MNADTKRLIAVAILSIAAVTVAITATSCRHKYVEKTRYEITGKYAGTFKGEFITSQCEKCGNNKSQTLWAGLP